MGWPVSHYWYPSRSIHIHTGHPNKSIPTYHMSKLKPHHANDASLFPSRELAQPSPILTTNGLEEYLINKIIDSQRRGRGWQFLVCWLGYGPQHDLWIAASELSHCEALDCWYEFGGDGPVRKADSARMKI